MYMVVFFRKIFFYVWCKRIDLVGKTVNKMKCCFYLALVLLISCKNEDKTLSKSDSTSSNTSITANFKTLDTALSFAGYWVNEDYATTIKISKSPKATDVLERSCISIPTRTLQQTVFVYGFHEGGEQIVIVKNGNDYEVWNAELTAKRDKVELLADNRIKIGKDVFVKISYIDSKQQMHEPDILAAILFKGLYQNIDGSKVELSDDGTLKGLNGFDKYSPIIDYADEGMQVD